MCLSPKPHGQIQQKVGKKSLNNALNVLSFVLPRRFGNPYRRPGESVQMHVHV